MRNETLVPFVVIACLIGATAWGQNAGAARAYRISGVVVNSVTGRPLAQAHVTAHPEEGQAKERTATTGTDGRFAFENVPAGKWRLSADRKNYIQQSYGQHVAYSAEESFVVTGPDAASENLSFRLDPPAAIGGKVTDERGEPLANAHIQLLVQFPLARKRFVIAKATMTDDTGEYRIGDLPPIACYVVAMVPFPAPSENGEAGGFAPQYYRKASDPRTASLIQLKPGDDVTADFSMRRSKGVSVKLEGDSGIQGGSAAELLLLLSKGPQGSEVSSGTLSPGMGRTFQNVLPGRYKLVIVDVGSTHYISRWIEVGEEDVTVNLPFPDPAEVTAKVRVAEGDATLLQKTMVGLRLEGSSGGDARPIEADGTVKFPAMAAGRYSVELVARQSSATGPYVTVKDSEQFYVKSVTARNARVTERYIEVPEAGAVQVEVVAGADGARVKGKVRAGGKPVGAAMVVLAPVRASDNPDDYHSHQSATDGSFAFQAVKPGEYMLFATNDAQLEYGNPEAVQAYFPAATRIKAEPNGSVELELAPLR